MLYGPIPITWAKPGSTFPVDSPESLAQGPSPTTPLPQAPVVASPASRASPNGVPKCPWAKDHKSHPQPTPLATLGQPAAIAKAKSAGKASSWNHCH